MSNEIVKFSNQFNNVALKKFDAVHLDVLMAIASRVREKGTATVEFSFEELRGLMRLRKNLTNRQLADKIVQTNARLLALNYMFEDSGKIIQFALFTKFVTDPQEATLAVGVNEEFAFLLNDLTSQFTRFELAEFADLKSKYAKEFYRRAKQYRSSGIWKISRDEFCRLLSVPKSTAEQVRDLNKRVLKPIIEECGPLLGLKIERQYVKRRLSGFVFTFARETGLRPVPRRQRGHESHRRNRPAHPQIAKVRNHNRHGSGGIANRASHRTTASPRPAAKLHAQPPAHRTPDRSAAAGSVGLARTA